LAQFASGKETEVNTRYTWCIPLDLRHHSASSKPWQVPETDATMDQLCQ
jgi:hypothetical protein